MKLTAFEYGKTEITERMAFQDGRPDVKLPISLMFFLIETGERNILVDVGCDTMPGFTLFEFQKPVAVLEQYGVNRKEITDVLLTHAHHDHIDCLRYYPQANVYLQEYEADAAENYLINKSKLHTFKSSIQISEEIVMQHVGGHSPGSSVVLVTSKQGKFILCGDECYTRDNFIKNKPTGSSFCLEKSALFVETYRSSSYRPILFHDPQIVNKLGFHTII